MEIQLNELSKGDKTSDNPNRYNLRSNNKEGKSVIPYQPPREENITHDVASNSKERKAQKFPPVSKGPTLEVKDILKPPSNFNFPHEIQKIRIPVPLSKLVKHKDFKKSLTKLLLPEPLLFPPESINL
jgi:hypothetical protein